MLVGGLSPGGASAQALRLRANAVAQTRSPVGLLVLEGQDRKAPWLDAESVVWLGLTDPASANAALGTAGDVVTVSVRFRDVKSGSELRVGRMVVSMGAVRPIHLDGARGLVRVLGDNTFETFVGAPVQPRFDYRKAEWAAGGRLGRGFADTALVGASYFRRQSDGDRADEEVGLDVTLTPKAWLTATGRASFDLLARGPADVLASVSAQSEDVRIEAFTTHRSPGRLLPATSLFSVLGDYAATSVGSTVRWRAFPRLELVATGSLQSQGDEIGGQGTGRATLSLDDAWAGTIGFEMRRVQLGNSRWIGARALVALPLASRFRVGAEVEIVRPDDPRGRGSLWPWVLGAVGYRPSEGWDIAIGLEASAGPSSRGEAHGLVRVSYAFERGGR